ncbi:hypothetical protein THAOC_14881 [Thalassiosira oceanica]|uniref:Mitochondrial import inner membrane translocase subunit TIM23 n=1 Tax=Thalassiosira oceanica TaxID=159749 RepID=K0SE30_THAOC|nr:hypothetical protein THAOC_14881 [Thalassiosira oceanica]|mmetsp:Transcript_26980/g.64011  ORF Transcript_26980/g.64011 Transcript_26980/m.64011 type:complete len:214 (+) Transcript_26980:247-888(+)|eukprot:EJK64388.1 hypothetical protein THAOC_14881 [Thalassiosira oceanica]
MNLNSNIGTGKGGASPFDSDTNDDSGAPLPDFNASNIKLQTVAPAFGISSSSLPAGVSQPDYLEYDQSRGVTTIMFTNSGISYMLGVTLGGLYGLREGLAKTPSSRFKVKLNSILNHCGRNGSVVGNMLGATSILYSLYEGLADTYDLDQYTGPIQPPAPLFAGAMTGATYYMRAGPRVAALAGSIGLASVGGTFAIYSMLGLPYGSKGWLWF